MSEHGVDGEAEAREAAIQARADACNAIPSSWQCGEDDTPGTCWDCYNYEKTMKRVAEEALDAERAEVKRLTEQNAALRALVEEALWQCDCNWSHPGCSNCVSIRERLAALALPTTVAP